MKQAIVAILLFLLCDGSEDLEFATLHPEDNQILFYDKGSVVNKATFLHIRFLVDMNGPLTELDRIIGSLKVLNEEDGKNAKKTLLPLLDKGKSVVSTWKNGEHTELYRNRALDGVAITSMLLAMFDELTKELQGVLMVVPENYDMHENTMTHVRTRRDMDGWSLAPDSIDPYEDLLPHEREKRDSIVGTLALVVAARNAWKIDTLEKHMSNISSEFNHMVDSLQLLSNQHVQLAVDVQAMKDLFKIIQHRNYHKVITSALVLANQLSRTRDTLHSIITAGQQRKVSTQLVYGQDLIQLFKAVEKKAKELNCDMILQQPADLYEVEASYGYDQNGNVFAIYMHVPLVAKNERLDLYEHFPFPILQSYSTNSTILPMTGNDKYIAVLPVPTEVSVDQPTQPYRYRVFNEVELEKCSRIRTTYLCGGRNTLKTDIEASCIGSLWLREHSLIAKNCDMEVLPPREFVTKLAPSKWIIYSPQNYSAPVVCGSTAKPSKGYNARIEKQTIVTLPEDCVLNLRKHQLSTDLNIFIDFKIETHEWRFDGNIFDDLTKNQVELNSMIQELISSKSKFGLRDLSHLKHYFQHSSDKLSQLWGYVSNLSIFSWFGNIYNFVTIFIFAWVFYLAYSKGFCRIARRRKGQIEGLPLRNPILAGSVRRPARPAIRFVKGPDELVFSSQSRNAANPVVIDMPRYPALELEDPYAPRAPMSEEGFLEELPISSECNPGSLDSKHKLENFVCNFHVPKGAPGHCMGYFRPAH